MKDFRNASIIDVRTPQEFAHGNYPGAINIPLDRLPQHITEIKDMKKPIVIYCRSGNRSGMATAILQQSGVPEVYNGGSLDDLLQQLK